MAAAADGKNTEGKGGPQRDWRGRGGKLRSTPIGYAKDSSYSCGDARRPKHILISTVFHEPRPLCGQIPSSVRQLGDQGSGIWCWSCIAAVVGAWRAANRSRVLLRSLEGFDFFMQEVYEERNGEGTLRMVGDSVGTGK